MRVLSTCSGIAADAVAWAPLGWTHVAFAEIAPFPSRVLAHRWPTVPNLGDFTAIGESDVLSNVDLLVGGTPCQDFSVAGLRAGIAGERGALSLEFLRLADRIRPRWIVWENVPGVLHSDSGRALGAFLGGVAELGYGFAYRVLDAQFFGLAQRRKRVFVVGCAGGQWQRAAAVLLEREGLRGDPPPRRAQGQDVAGCLEARARTGGYDPGPHGAASGHLVAGALKASDGKSGPGLDGAIAGHVVAGTTEIPLAVQEDNQNGVTVRDTVGTLRSTAPGSQPGGSLILAALACDLYNGRVADVAATLATRGGGTKSGPSALIPFDTTQVTSPENRSKCEPGDPAPSLARKVRAPAIAFHQTQDPIDAEELSPALGRTSSDMGIAHAAAAVRRLTPRECERLMGFPDDYTAIPKSKDGPRYAALGNSIAVPVLRWIGERIAHVNAIGRGQ